MLSVRGACGTLLLEHRPLRCLVKQLEGNCPLGSLDVNRDNTRERAGALATRSQLIRGCSEARPRAMATSVPVPDTGTARRQSDPHPIALRPPPVEDEGAVILNPSAFATSPVADCLSPTATQLQQHFKPQPRRSPPTVAAVAQRVVGFEDRSRSHSPLAAHASSSRASASPHLTTVVSTETTATAAALSRRATAMCMDSAAPAAAAVTPTPDAPSPIPTL